jgi:hypothetical protein
VGVVSKGEGLTIAGFVVFLQANSGPGLPSFEFLEHKCKILNYA